MYTRATSLPNLYIRNIIPDEMRVPSSASLALSGWGYTDFHASVNFAFIEFYEVRVLGILGSSLPIRHQCLKIRNLSDTLLYLMGVRYIRIMDR
jgi:hypothetical protein